MSRLPDDELHDMLHRLGKLQEELNELLTQIYIHIELKSKEEE